MNTFNDSKPKPSGLGKVILLGPRSAGKSTTLKEVVSRYATENIIEMDKAIDQLLAPRSSLEQAINQAQWALIENAITSIMQTAKRFDSLIMDIPAGALTYGVVRESLSDFLVIGLVPSSDKPRAVDILLARERTRSHIQKRLQCAQDTSAELKRLKSELASGIELTEKHADQLIYTDGLSSSQIVDAFFKDIFSG